MNRKCNSRGKRSVSFSFTVGHERGLLLLDVGGLVDLGEWVSERALVKFDLDVEARGHGEAGDTWDDILASSFVSAAFSSGLASIIL